MWLDVFLSTVDEKMRELSENNFAPKARLVVRGFEENKLPKVDTQSPVVQRELIKVFLSISVMRNWEPKSLDVKTAFLQGNSLERPLFIRPPKEAARPRGVLGRLLKPVYGLQDASHKWFLRVQTKLQELGFLECPFEPALFVLKGDKKLRGIIVLHVDDFLYAGDDWFVLKVMPGLKNAFTIGKEFECPMRFTGVNIKLDRGNACTTIDQK